MTTKAKPAAPKLPPPRRLKELPIDRLKMLVCLQQRAEGLDGPTVTRYQTILDNLAEVVVYEMTEDGELDGEAVRRGDFVIGGDGFHTYEAAVREGRKTLRCELRDGVVMDAGENSLGANARNALQRSTADEDKSIRTALRWNKEHNKGWSNRDIARKCGIAEDGQRVARMVEKMRQEEGELRRCRNSDQKGSQAASGGSSPTPSATRDAPADPIKAAVADGEQNRREMEEETADDPIERAVQLGMLKGAALDELAALAMTYSSLGLWDRAEAYVDSLKDLLEEAE